MNHRIWLTTAQAVEHTGYHVQTIRRAAESGELHGSQRKAGGRWRFHRDCLDAWVSGSNCAHQEEASA